MQLQHSGRLASDSKTGAHSNKENSQQKKQKKKNEPKRPAQDWSDDLRWEGTAAYIV